MNYKRLAFILSILLAYFILTDTFFERQIKNSAWSLIGIASDEGQQVASDAPTSFIDTLEVGRIGFAKFVLTSKEKIATISSNSKNPLTYLYTFFILFLNFVYYLSSYIITFYPILILLLYYILTSRMFKKDNYLNDYGN